jgi:hypothetical protein
MPKTFTVGNKTELYAALKASAAGDTIKLKSGDYGELALSGKSGFDLNFEGVKITSADPARPAVFSGLDLAGVSNLKIDSVVFDYTFKAGDVSYHKPFGVYGGANVTISNAEFDGDVARGVSSAADGYGYAHGLTVTGTTGFRLENSEIHGFLRGAVFGDSKNVTVTGNEVHDIRMDGMNFSDVQGVRIEGNHFHDFRASPTSGDHRDMIQFWTNGTKEPSTGIVIRGNTFDIGEGSYTQSIFMRNEEVDTGRAGTEMFYRNVLIEQNTIYNGHLHGITVGETAGLTIRNNSVLAVADDSNPSSSSVWIPTIRVAPRSTSVEITANVTADITGHSGQAGWTVRGNAYVQNTNPHAPGYYNDVFVTSSMSGADGSHNFVALPGSMVDTLNAGSTATQPPAKVTSEAFFHVEAGDGGVRVFDAGLTADLLGAAGAGARYVWTFGDGSTAQGKVVSHGFTAGDVYDVKLTVTLTSGKVIGATGEVEVRGPQVITYDADARAFVAHDAGEDKTLAQLSSLDGSEIQLVRTGTAASVWGGHLQALRGSDEFAIDFTLQGDGKGGMGELFRMHGSFIASVTGTGAVVFQIFDAAGKSTWLQTKAGVVVNDGAPHAISIDVADGRATIRVDGAPAASVAFTGMLPTSGSDLIFGNPWNKTNFVGDIGAFAITADAGSYPARPVSTVLEADSADAAVQAAESDLSLSFAVAEEPVAEAVLAVAEPVADPGLEGMTLDIAKLAGSSMLVDDAHVATRDGQAVLVLDGSGDYVNLGRRTQYESYERIGFAVDFSRSGDMAGEERLVWNHQKIGLTLVGDGLMVQLATADQGFRAYTVRDLGLSDTDAHRATVLLDTREDRLQVLLDGAVVLDVEDADFHLAGAGGRESGWMIGNPWSRHFEGEVSGFELGDRFDFLESSAPVSQNLML